MTRFAGGTFKPEDFETTFGLSSVSEDEAYSKGSSTGTKQVSGLGTYMNQDDFERLRNDDQVWQAYGAIYGEDKMKAKREGNEEGLSINALDALMDKLAAEEQAPEKEPDPVPDSIKQFPDQVINARNTIEDFNNNYSNIWNENAGENTAFMKQYSFAGAEKLPATGGVALNREAAAHIAPAERSSSNYRNAKDRAQSFSYQQASDVMGMP